MSDAATRILLRRSQETVDEVLGRSRSALKWVQRQLPGVSVRSDKTDYGMTR